MSDTTPTRPRQVTVAAWLIMVGSVVVVLSVFERVSGLRSLETRKAVERFLSEPPGDGLGIGTESVLDTLHVVSLVAGGCAAAMAVLGYQLLHRSKAARLALTVLAVPLFLTGLVAGGFLSSLVAAATVMLWFQPARDWFDGITRPRPAPPGPETQAGPHPAHLPGDLPRYGAPPAPGHEHGPEHGPEHGHGHGPGPRPVSGFGAPPTPPVGAPGAAPGAPGAWPVGAPPRPAAPSTRPPALAWACALTWLLSALTLLVLGLLLALAIAAPDVLLDEAAFEEARQQYTPSLEVELPTEAELIAGTAILTGLGLLWVGAGSVLAVIAWRRVSWAHLSLFVLTVISAVGCLVMAPFTLVTVVPLVGYVVAARLLWRPEVRAWFAARGSMRP